MTSTYPSRILSISIDRPLEQVYDYIYELKHFPDWATSFCLSIQVAGDEGRMETPEGPAVIRFVERNRWGVLDHWVSARNGTGELYFPARRPERSGERAGLYAASAARCDRRGFLG
ncbi:hypothetical protein ACHHV8_34880 [Paenibacillus sp. TAB 01]|uniref:hypothetical protein n=1 Tax=Paenibacillus sp. TAB 01 TaxID=3368988 RepID=UPI0037504EEE